MTLALQWIVLLVCAACTVWRFPAMVKGRNSSLFWAFAALSVSVALSIPDLYMPIDALLGGVNLANVILRLGLFTVFFLLGAKIAAAYNSERALWLVRGPVGVTVVSACTAGILISYALSDLRGSSTGLSAFSGQTSLDVYFWIGYLYTAYVAACLIVPTGKAARPGRPLLDRTAALLMCLGFTLSCVRVPAQLSPWQDTGLVQLISYTAILSVAVGLAMVWISFIRRPLRGKISS